MIPQGGTLRNEPVQERQQPSKTWKIDFDRGRVVGLTDGLEAIKQTVFCILETDRFRHLIYSFNYGNELNRLFGMDRLFVESEINRLIREALLQDDRITNVDQVEMQAIGDSMKVSFRVITGIGSFNMEVGMSV